MCRPLLLTGVSRVDRPDRPGVTALIAELNVRRHARVAVGVGIGFALLVFVLFAYLPGTDESILYWASLTFVLAFAASVLVAAVLVGQAAYRRTRELNDTEPGTRSATTLAILFGALGWLLVPVIAAVALGRLSPEQQLSVALLSAGFAAVVVGGLGLKLVGALSLSHEWRPQSALVGAIVYTALVAAPAVAPTARLGTPNELVTAVVGLDPTAVAPTYAAVTLGGGFLLGAALALRSAAPPHGFFAGVVAAVSVLPIVAATTATPEVVRTTGLYLPVLLGTVSAAGGGVVIAARSVRG